jgi:hypothetical protein
MEWLPTMLSRLRKLAAQGALTATGAQEEVSAASEGRTLQNQIRQLQRLLGKRTLEAKILKEALGSRHRAKTAAIGLAVVAQGRFVMSAVCATLQVARSNIAELVANRSAKRRGQAGLPHALLTIRSSIGEESLPVFPAAAQTAGNCAHLGKFNRQVWGVSLRYQQKLR